MADALGASGDSSWVVEVDPDIADLVPGFLDNRRRDVGKAREALRRGDLAELAILGHTMKGAGAGYGFDEITVIGAAMEQSAKHTDLQAAEEAVARLAHYLDHVEVRY